MNLYDEYTKTKLELEIFFEKKFNIIVEVSVGRLESVLIRVTDKEKAFNLMKQLTDIYYTINASGVKGEEQSYMFVIYKDQLNQKLKEWFTKHLKDERNRD